MKHQSFGRMYKGTLVRFEHKDGPHGPRWDVHFTGKKKPYATGVLDSVPRGLVTLWRVAKNTIDMHLRETGYVP